MTFSDKTLTLLVLVAIGLASLGVIFGLIGSGGRRTHSVEPGAPIRLDETLRGILEGQAGQIVRLEKAVRSLHATSKPTDVLDRLALRLLRSSLESRRTH